MRDYEELVSCLRIEADGLLVDDKPDMLLHDSLRDAADAIEELQSYADLYKELTEKGQTVARKLIDAYPKWISVEERLPEKYDQVLVYGRNGVQIDYYTGEKSVCGNPLFMVSEAKVTHWLYVPEPPKEDADDSD